MTLIEAVNAWTAGTRLRRAGDKQSYSLFAVLECCDVASPYSALLNRTDMLARDWQVVPADGAAPRQTAPARRVRSQARVTAVRSSRSSIKRAS